MRASELRHVGFIFVGASWCGICKRAAPVLAAMTEPAGLPVLVVSEDGRPIPPFPTAILPEGHPLAAGVHQYPTTFIYAPWADRVVDEVVGYRNARAYAERVARAVGRARGSP
ncbi:conjugal transfer protein TraF [Chachezhania sediminis]|uniref:conjugal transfer protein TraF n=1 Tax=Chachezhania sediminis TaxID=2599291 RepID=UPI001E38A20D|nr:conjugal transfer protein TraF [Chachezhania sediminis]